MLFDRCRERAILVATVGFTVAVSVVAEDDSPNADAVVKKERLEKARRFVQSIEIRKSGDDGEAVLVPVQSEPVLFFSDQPRNNPFGSVWVWGEAGRPAAIIEVYTSADSDYANVMHSLCAGRLTGASRQGWTWRPDAPGIRFHPLIGAPHPADRETARSTQLRALAREFKLVQREYYDPDGARTDLRLLPKPIHRYQDPDRGIIDGALFAYVHGETNPEAILMLEAHEGLDGSEWQFDFVRLGHAEMWARRNGEEAWHVDRLEGLNANTATYFYVNPQLVGVQ